MGGKIGTNTQTAVTSAGGVGPAGGSKGPLVQVKAAPAGQDAQRLTAAGQHRAQCMDNFQRALESAHRGKLPAWIMTAGSHVEQNRERSDAFAKALQAGAGRLASIRAMQPSAAVGAVSSIEQVNRELEVGTQVLSTIQNAKHLYDGALEIWRSGSEAQKWNAAQDLGGVVEKLRQTLRDNQAGDGSIGIFRGDAARDMAACIRQLATVISNHQRTFEGAVRQNANGLGHVKSLFEARDQIDSKINELFDRLPKDKKTVLPEATLKQIRESVRRLTVERDHFNQLIASALKDGPPQAAPQKRGMLRRLLMPNKLQQHFDQEAVTRRAAQGKPFQPPAGLDGRSALAAHLKGVFQAAGFKDDALPSRRELRNRIENWQPAAPPAARAPIHQPRPVVVAVSQKLDQVGQLHQQVGSQLKAAQIQGDDLGRHLQSTNEQAAEILAVKAKSSAGEYKISSSAMQQAMQVYEATDWEALADEVKQEPKETGIERQPGSQKAPGVDDEADLENELAEIEQDEIRQQTELDKRIDELLEESEAADIERQAQLEAQWEAAYGQLEEAGGGRR